MLMKRNQDREWLPTLHGLDDLWSSVWNNFDPFSAWEGFPENRTFAHLSCEVKDKEVQVKLPVPGIKNDEIKVEIEKNMLTVRVVRQREQKSDPTREHQLIRRERLLENFEQSIRLPVAVLSEQAQAVCRDGVLHITLPREVCEAKAPRQIPVSKA